MSEGTPIINVESVEVPPKQVGGAALVRIAERGVALRTLEDLIRFARLIVEGGAAPSWAFGGGDQADERVLKRAAGSVAVAIQAGLEHGLGIMGGLQAFIVLDGHVTWRGEAAAAKIRTSAACKPGTLQFGCDGDGEQRRGWAQAWRIGDPETSRREFTFRQAKTAGLLGKKNWMTYPERMYQWRALAWLAKDKFSDVLGGFPLAEEVEDFGAPAPAARVERASLPAPAALDPLMAELGLEAPAKPAPEPVAVDTAPFPSHAEADRAIAEAEGQADLFAK